MPNFHYTKVIAFHQEAFYVFAAIIQAIATKSRIQTPPAGRSAECDLMHQELDALLTEEI